MVPALHPLGPQVGDKVLYFAYGANVNPNTLARRGIRTPQGAIARVTDPNVALLFGHRAGYATLSDTSMGLKKGPGMPWRWFSEWQQFPARESTEANRNLIYWQPYGVLYALTPDQLMAIAESEIGYTMTTLEVSLMQEDEDQLSNFLPELQNASVVANNNISSAITPSFPHHRSVDAVVFVSSPWVALRHPVPPTQRYRDLILEGGKNWGLPEEYLAWLEQLPAVPTAALSEPQYEDTPINIATKVIGSGTLIGGTLAAHYHHIF